MAENTNRTGHWLRVDYGLKRLRKGLEHFVDRASRELYKDVYIIGLTSAVCNTCQLNKHCPNGVFKQPRGIGYSFCSKNNCDSICDQILSTYYPYQILGKTPIWANTDSTKWTDRNIGYWEVAKCFLSCPGYLDKEGPNKIDACGLLSICLNNTKIRSSITNVPLFEEVRDIRNKVNNTADYKLDKHTADVYLEKMIEVLNDAQDLRSDSFAVENRRRLNEIKNGKIICSRTLSAQMKLEVSAHDLNDVEDEDPRSRKRKMDDEVETYYMKEEPFGKLLIFYNRKCGAEPEMESCRLDADLMENTLRGKFETVRFENKTLKEMQTILRGIESLLTKDDSCLICYFSSHGNNEGVLTLDGKTLPYRDIYNALRNDSLPCMNGRPKLVILDCCQGPKDNQSTSHSVAKSYTFSEKIHSDMAILKASPDGYLAMGSTIEPSVFTSAFCKAFAEVGSHVYSHIVYKTTAIIRDNGNPRQCVPESVTYLTAKLIFKSSR